MLNSNSNYYSQYSNGQTYKKQRKILAPAFHVSAVKSYTSIMNKGAKDLVKRLLSTKGQTTEDIIDILSESTARIIFETNLGKEQTNPEENRILVKAIKDLGELFIRRTFHPWLGFEISLRLFPYARKVCGLVSSVKQNILKPRLENLKASIISRRDSPDKDEGDFQMYGKKPKPFGETFIEQHLQDPTLTIDDIVSQTLLIAAAGFDTVVHAMQCTLFLLGLHQDVQDRARQEVMTETEEFITSDDSQSLIYLECVIKESLRLYPPVPVFGRYIKKELQCGEYKIPRNSNIFIFSYMVHRNPEIYPDPEKFDPERFMNKNIKPWQFIPFAEGLRHCTGKYYAMFQMKIILAHILRNFTIISLDRREDIKLEWSIVLEFANKLRMQFIPK